MRLKMKKKLITFSTLLVIAVAAFFLIQGEGTNNVKALETSSGASETKQEAVLVKKGELNNSAKAKLLQNLAGDYFMGNEFAPVLMIEYASLSCPHCANFQEAVLNDLIVSHVNTGKVRYIYRDFPLNAPAFDASKLAMCADKENYFNFIKVLFKSQESWVLADDPKVVLKNIAKLGGVSDEQFDKCMADEELEAKILSVKKDAVDVLGIASTPTIFINGVEFEGEHTHEEVAKYIDSLLKP